MPFLTRFMLFSIITLAVGLGSAWHFVDSGFFATTRHFGPWVIWFREGASDADPYTLAHLSRLGTLPVTAASFLDFTATHDSQGSQLSGDCTYEIKGVSFPALWWNLSAFKEDGEPIPSKARRSSVNGSDILAAPDGKFVVRLSAQVQPGNWLPAVEGEPVVLKLTILRSLKADSLLESGGEVLPEISLVECG